MIEQRVLTDLGLTEIEAKVYLAALELGQDTVLNIAKKAGVKRPTCYVTLDNLFERGMVTKIEKKTTTFYAAEEPKLILNKYKQKIANFQDLLPFFEAKFSKGPKPKIRYYEGKEEILEIYRKVIWTGKENYFFGTDIGKLMSTFPNLIPEFEKTAYGKGKTALELLSNDNIAKEYQKKYGPKRPVRLMPEDLPVHSDIAITENAIYIVSLDNLFSVLIQSEDLAKSFKNFFLLAWRAAE